MKKLFTLALAALFSVSMLADTAILSWYLGENGTEATAANSITGATGSAAEGWTIAMTGNLDKNWAGTSSKISYNGTAYKTLKNSNGVQNTVTLPEGLYASKVVFYAVTNNTEVVGFLKEFDGKTAKDTVFSLTDYDNPTIITKELDIPKNEFTFNFGGRQVCFIAIVTYSDQVPEVPEVPAPHGLLSWHLGENGAEATAANSITGATGSAAEGWTIAITGNLDKNWGAGGKISYNGTIYKTLKNSNGAQNTITLPDGLYASKVVFYAVTNNDTVVGLLKEFDGKTAKDTVFSLMGFDNPTIITKELEIPKNEFTFTFGGKQVCFIAAVNYSNEAPVIASGTCGENLTWKLSYDSVLTISGTGAMEDYARSNIPWREYRDIIKSVIIEEGVTSLVKSAFAWSNSIISVTIPSTLVNIGDEAFEGCSVLISIDVANNNQQYCSVDGILFNKEQTTLIQYPIGKENRSYTIPNTVANIKDFAFFNCKNITSVLIGNSVINIGDHAFAQCENIAAVTIGNSVKKIGDAAFYYCEALASIEIPSSVESIGEMALECRDLTHIDVDADNPYYCSADGVLFNKDKTTIVRYPEGKSNTSYRIPDGITSLGSYAFRDSRNLISIEIPNSVTRFLTQVFQDCNRLTSITIPKDVTTIESFTFRWCSGLTSVTNYATTPQTINANVFDYVDKSAITLYVPAESIEAYQDANVWKDFGTIKAIGSVSGLSCTEAIDFDTVNGNTHQGGETLWYRTHFYPTTIPDTCDIRMYLTNMSAEENFPAIELYFDCIDPTFYGGIFRLDAYEDAYFDLDRDLLETLGWPDLIIKYSSTKNSHIRTKLIPAQAQEAVMDTIIAYVCEGEEYLDTISYTTILIEKSMTWNDTVLFRDGLRVRDSITMFQIHPLVLPDPIPVDQMKEAGMAPTLVQGMPLDVETSDALLMQYYRNYANMVDTIVGIDTVYWAKPVYKSNGSLDAKKEASLDLITPYTSEDILDTLLLVIKASECSFMCRVPYVFPVEQGQETPCLIASGTCGENLTWELGCDSVLTISGTGEMTDFEWSVGGPWRSYYKAIKTITINNGVTSIGEEAFASCNNLISVTIPNSVTRIGYQSFSYCRRLPSITIPASVTKIEDNAFISCDSLKSITIPNSVTSIGRGAFEYCSNLVSIDVAADNSNFSSLDGVLFNKDKTTLIKYPEGKLDNTYTIPSSVVRIESYAFNNCSKLTSIPIPDNITYIGTDAFQNCSSLIAITIPKSVTTIGSWAFDWCSSLTSIDVATDNPNYCSIDGVLFNKEMTTLICYPEAKSNTSYTIPNGVTSIEGLAFDRCANLTSIELPNSITSIGGSVFKFCTGLTSITIPNGITSIRYGTFMGCSSLTSAILPASITSVGERAFDRCNNLISLTCEATTPPSVEVSTFSNKSAITLYVPAESIEAYQEANVWKEFGTILAIGATPAGMTDVITYQETGMKGETKTYGNFTFSGLPSGATYMLNAYDGANINYLQMHTKGDYSGLVTTKSAGFVRSVEITFNEKTTYRKVNIYGSNTAFTSPTELYADSLTLLDSIGAEDTTKKLTITGNYRYVGIRSSNGAIYIDEIDIEWGNFEEKATTILKFKSDTAEVEVGKTVALEVERDGNDAMTWTTSDASVATVANGVVTGVKEGTVKITATANNISDECTVTVKKAATPSEIPVKSIAEFIAAQGGKCKLIGIVGTIDNDQYGNFNLTDNSGTIYVYGLLTPEGESKKFNTLGVATGDTLTVIAETYKLYNDKPEVVNAIFVEVHKGSGVTPTPSGELDINYAEAAYFGYEAGSYWKVFAAKFDEASYNLNYPMLKMDINNTDSTHLAGEFNILNAVLYISDNDSIQFTNGEVSINCVKLAADEQSAPIYHFIDTLRDEAGKEYVYEFETEVWAYDGKNSTDENTVWINLADTLSGGVPGLEPDTISIAEALQIGMALDSMATSTETYTIEGYVINAGTFSSKYKYQTWYMADDPNTASSDFQAYQCYPMDGADTMAVYNGSRVRMTGQLQKYYNRQTATYVVEMKRVQATILSVPEIDTITVAEALAIGEKLAVGATNGTVYTIRGYVSSIEIPYDEQYKDQSFYIADDISSVAYSAQTGGFHVYRGKPADGMPIKEGAYVELTATIKKYNDAKIENAESNVLVTVLKEAPECRDLAGACGENLTWTLNTCDSALAISGTGAMYNYSKGEVLWSRFGVTSVNLGKGLTAIGKYDLYACQMPSIIIPASVTSIAASAFSRCPVLTDIFVEARNSEYSSIDGVLYSKDKKTILAHPIGRKGAYEIPDGVDTIGVAAFNACRDITSITLPNSATTIKEAAFFGCGISSMTIPASVDSIEGIAFVGCMNLTTIANYAVVPQKIDSTVFDGINLSACALYVPAESVKDYQTANVWKDFGSIIPMQAEEVTEQITDVETQPQDNSVIVTWPVVASADTYTLEIKKNGELICTLTFSSDGRLMGIAFAPSRNSGNPAPAAVKTDNGGLRFTVTGLNSGTQYNLDVIAKDAANQTIKTYQTVFTTTGTATGLESIQPSAASCQKILLDGHIYLMYNGTMYDVQGKKVR